MATKKFTIYVTEKLSRAVEVDAWNENDALEKVQSMYNDEDIVLDSDDFESVEFTVE